MMAKLVSIIINNYNYGSYLAEAIESALAQTWNNFEVIVVDDGSTDGSIEIIRSYEGRILPVLKSNGGQASAFNVGLSIARGEIIHFLDADDTLHPDAVARYIKFFENPKVIKVHAPLSLIDETGRCLGNSSPACILEEGSVQETALRYGPLSYCTAPTTGNAWRRTFLEQIMPIPESSFRISADAYLFALSPLYGEFRRLDTAIGCYRTHGKNAFYQREACFEPKHLAEKVVRFETLVSALAEHAERTGYKANTDVWRSRYWRLSVWRRLLMLMKEDVEPSSLSDLLSSIRHLRIPMLQRLLLYPVFTTLWIAPRPIAMRMGSFLLRS